MIICSVKNFTNYRKILVDLFNRIQKNISIFRTISLFDDWVKHVFCVTFLRKKCYVFDCFIDNLRIDWFAETEIYMSDIASFISVRRKKSEQNKKWIVYSEQLCVWMNDMCKTENLVGAINLKSYFRNVVCGLFSWPVFQTFSRRPLKLRITKSNSIRKTTVNLMHFNASTGTDHFC